VTGESTLYAVTGERYAPDVAFISKSRQPELSRVGANPNPPQLAVEVIADENRVSEQRLIRLKVSNYLSSGTTIWVVSANSQLVEVHRPGKPVQVLDSQGTLDGDTVLPGFTLVVREIFSE
jgi:Uma2 family endonuclease